MDAVEINLVAVGELFDKNLPVKGVLSLTFPNGKILELDVLDLLKVEKLA